MPAPPANELAPGTLLFNQYVVERVVGRLGSTVVVKVRHARHTGRFLLKHLTPEAAAEPFAVGHFLERARAATTLQSEYGARTVDAGRLSSGLPYLVTESFQGTELREIMRIRGALERTCAVDAVLEAMHAVAEAHRHGIAHGSLSLSSLQRTPGPEGRAMIKVLDFGSASTLQGDPFSVRLRRWHQGTAMFTESIRLWDTVACTAPERLRDSREATVAGDVWALGAILYELLLGVPPFSAQTTPALMAEIAADRPRKARELGRTLPRELERVVLRCLSKSPDERFSSVHELAEALKRFASREVRPLVDRIARLHDGDQEPVPRRIRRGHPANPLLLAAVGLLAGVLAGTYATRLLQLHAPGSVPPPIAPASQRR